MQLLIWSSGSWCTFTPLSWWFYHSCSAHLDSVCKEPKYGLGCVRPAGLTSSSRRVHRPYPSAYNSGHWTGFCQSGGSPPCREAWGLAGINCLVVGPDVVQQMGAWVIDWSPPPCCESCLAWLNFFCIGWLTCCAASARTILSALIRSFIAICSGGTSSWLNGTGLASGLYTCSRH